MTSARTAKALRRALGFGRAFDPAADPRPPDPDDLRPYFAALEPYPPLAREDEHALALAMRDPAGTAASRAAARAALILRNARLAGWVAGRYRGHGATLGDLTGWGTLGLIRAVDEFDPGRGVKLATFATWHVRSAIQQGLAAWLLGAAASLDATADGPDSGPDFTLAGTIPARPEPAAGDRPDPDGELAALLARLPDSDALGIEAVLLRFGVDDGRPRPYREVGALLGCSEYWARARGKATLRRLRELAGAPGAPAAKPPRIGPSAYRGVIRDGNRWRADVTHRNVVHRLGSFATEAEAAAAYDAAAVRLKGSKAKTNFRVPGEEAHHVA